MSNNVVERLHGEFTDLRDFLSATDGAKFVPVVEELLPKAMLLAVASYFEKHLSDEVERFAADEAGEEHVLRWVIKRKVISRQYHTWFAWDSQRSVNSFFSMFGPDFKDEASRWIEEDEDLQSSIIAFLEIGRERNRLVHESFGEAPLYNKTTADVYGLYESARNFVDWVPKALRRFSSEQSAVGGS